MSRDLAYKSLEFAWRGTYVVVTILNARVVSFLQLAAPLTWCITIWEHIEEGTLDFPHHILCQQRPSALLEGKPGGSACDH